MGNTFDRPGGSVKRSAVILVAVALLLAGCAAPRTATHAPVTQTTTPAATATSYVSAGDAIRLDSGLSLKVPVGWSGVTDSSPSKRLATFASLGRMDRSGEPPEIETVWFGSNITTATLRTAQRWPALTLLRSSGVLRLYVVGPSGAWSAHHAYVIEASVGNARPGIIFYGGSGDPLTLVRYVWAMFDTSGARVPGTWR